MQHRERRVEALREARDQLRSEGDLRHEHKGLFATCHDGLDGAQVHLSLATAGNAVQQERGECAPCRRDRVDGSSLLRRRLQPLRRPHLASRWRLFRNAQPRNPSSLLELARVIAPARRKCCEFRRIGALASAQELRQFAQPVRTTRQRWQLVRAGGGGQRPSLRGLQHRSAGAQCRGQRGCDHLARGMTVVVGRPPEQFEQGLIEDRFVVDYAECRLQLGVRQVRSITGLNEYTDDAPAAERYPEPHARPEACDVRSCWRPVIEKSPEWRIDGDGEDGAQAANRLCEVVHNGCGKVCG